MCRGRCGGTTVTQRVMTELAHTRSSTDRRGLDRQRRRRADRVWPGRRVVQAVSGGQRQRAKGTERRGGAGKGVERAGKDFKCLDSTFSSILLFPRRQNSPRRACCFPLFSSARLRRDAARSSAAIPHRGDGEACESDVLVLTHWVIRSPS
jgi:hypothetical protein